MNSLCFVNGKMGRLEIALSFCERFVAMQPTSGLAWSGKGHAMLRFGRLDEAVVGLETAVLLQPEVASPLISLGEARLLQRPFGHAIDALQRALVLPPKALDARLFLGQAYLGARRSDLASPQFEAVPLQTRYQLIRAGQCSNSGQI